MKIKSISISDPCFDGKISNIPGAPKQLFCLGNVTVNGPTVAMIGSRKPTVYGRAVTLELAEKLARRGVIVVSGLALGVDGLAHQGALRGGGRTVAVLASGLDQISPRSHRQLAIDLLAQNGGLLSEYEPGMPPLAHQFLARNRLVSALADAVIVTEASARSGTMNTIMHALSQGKDVYAVPGNITSPTSAGCNKLIEQGATPIIDIDAFVEHFAPRVSNPKQALLLAENPAEQAIVDLMRAGVSDADELQRRTKLAAVDFSTALTMLELRGVIHPLGTNHWGL